MRQVQTGRSDRREPRESKNCQKQSCASIPGDGIDIMYNEGISKEGDIIDTGVKYEVVAKSGNSFSFGETKLGVGYDASRKFLSENKDVSKELLKQIKAKLSE